MKSLNDIAQLNSVIDTHLLHCEPLEEQFNWWFELFEELTNKKSIPERILAHLEKLNNVVDNILKSIEEIPLFQDIDIFGELYQQLVDRQIRKSLGEFYTPLPVVKTIIVDGPYNA